MGRSERVEVSSGRRAGYRRACYRNRDEYHRAAAVFGSLLPPGGFHRGERNELPARQGLRRACQSGTHRGAHRGGPQSNKGNDETREHRGQSEITEKCISSVASCSSRYPLRLKDWSVQNRRKRERVRIVRQKHNGPNQESLSSSVSPCLCGSTDRSMGPIRVARIFARRQPQPKERSNFTTDFTDGHGKRQCLYPCFQRIPWALSSSRLSPAQPRRPFHEQHAASVAPASPRPAENSRARTETPGSLAGGRSPAQEVVCAQDGDVVPIQIRPPALVPIVREHHHTRSPSPVWRRFAWAFC